MTDAQLKTYGEHYLTGLRICGDVPTLDDVIAEYEKRDPGNTRRLPALKKLKESLR